MPESFRLPLTKVAHWAIFVLILPYEKYKVIRLDMQTVMEYRLRRRSLLRIYCTSHNARDEMNSMQIAILMLLRLRLDKASQELDAFITEEALKYKAIVNCEPREAQSIVFHQDGGAVDDTSAFHGFLSAKLYLEVLNPPNPNIFTSECQISSQVSKLE
jgi:hypothetical protein